MSRVLLVIPCFKESQRLPGFLGDLCEALRAANLAVDVLAVDDGSGTSEATFLAESIGRLRPVHPFLLKPLLLERNRGKGGAVYAGWDTAGDDHEWLAFVDADGAISAAEVVRGLGSVAETAPEAMFAVRSGEGNTEVRRTRIRRLTGWVFAILVKILFDLPVPDTQCGFKMVPRAWYFEHRAKFIEERFCFDIELAYWLVRAGVKIRVVPISWEEAPGSHLGFSHVTHMFGSLLVLRRRFSRREERSY